MAVVKMVKKYLPPGLDYYLQAMSPSVNSTTCFERYRLRAGRLGRCFAIGSGERLTFGKGMVGAQTSTTDG